MMIIVVRKAIEHLTMIFFFNIHHHKMNDDPDVGIPAERDLCEDHLFQCQHTGIAQQVSQLTSKAINAVIADVNNITLPTSEEEPELLATGWRSKSTTDGSTDFSLPWMASCRSVPSQVKWSVPTQQTTSVGTRKFMPSTSKLPSITTCNSDMFLLPPLERPTTEEHS
jgi:hypothetical protein